MDEKLAKLGNVSRDQTRVGGLLRAVCVSLFPFCISICGVSVCLSVSLWSVVAVGKYIRRQAKMIGDRKKPCFS